MAEKRQIHVRGAREHNLKNISVAIPKETLTIITGPSGSGKSTLALDILHAEGQRRYIESLSSYARQFLGTPQKPDVDQIDGLCPSVAISQKTVGSNPRSTIGTITEIYDYLRVLFARIGKLHCPHCASPIQPATPASVAAIIQENHAGASLMVVAPIVIDKKGEFVHELEELFDQGYYRFLVDGSRVNFKTRDDIKKLGLKKSHKHTIDLLLDSFTDGDLDEVRLFEALEKSFTLTDGRCKIIVGERAYTYSAARMCVACGDSFPEVEPRLFSFNAPQGACGVCHGLGLEPELLFQKQEGFFEGVRSYDTEPTCRACAGRRLNPHALAVTVGGKNIWQVSDLSIKRGLEFIQKLSLTAEEQQIAQRLLTEIISRYTFLRNVGLDYLALTRTARTLSGGEGQRIRLATQLGSALSGVLYILDEPSIGLHQRDNDRLIATLHKLRDQGNTVVVVEHDFDTMRAADYLIDMGPAAGILGGQITAVGTPQEFVEHPVSLTGEYLSGKRAIVRAHGLRTPQGFITLRDVSVHNIQHLTVKFPLGVLCGISGVSGSGKSSLIMSALVPALDKALKPAIAGGYHDVEKLEGVEQIENLVVIDQSPIGRSSRSNPATYLGIFDEIRALFATLPESNARGYTVGRFSFNVAEGRCKQCAGNGTITVSMHFLPDVTVICSGCKGLRYNKQTLDITYRGKHIADILRMTAREALEFFAAHSRLAKRLQLLCDVGLDYIQLGQESTTLSGGEAQRIKLVDELAKRGSRTLYVLDEPTTGLHAIDIERLLMVFDRLVHKGNSVLVIEHNLDVLKTVDYIIDLGPEGGEAGGNVVAEGTPYEVAAVATSYTGRYLARVMEK